MGRWIWIWISICGGLLNPIWIWFRWPERLVIFTFGLVYSKGLMTYVLDNLMTFLTDFWKLKLKEAAAIVNLQQGLRNMLQIYVALCIDLWFGYGWMLILSSVLYSAGLFLLAFSVPEYFFDGEGCTPQKNIKYYCFKKLKDTPFWEGLGLLIVGGAAQVIPLYSLSFDQTRVVKPPQDCEPTRVKLIGCLKLKVHIRGWRQLQQKVIRWLCYGFLMLGIITSFYGFISFEDKWHQRFRQSAIAIIIGLLWFLCGFPFYGPRRLHSSPLLTMLRTMIAALRKRHLNYQENLDKLHRGDGDDRNQLLSDHLKLLNNAAVKESSADEMEKHRWRLCTVKDVEQTKLLLDIIPMSATFIVYGMVISLGNTFFIEQADSMRGDIPIVVLQLIQHVSKSVVNKVYKMVFERRIQRIKKLYSDGVKIGLGMLASIICCAVASSVESKRLKALREIGLLDHPNGPDSKVEAPTSAAEPPISTAVAPISAAWLLLQFFFLGAMEGLAGDGIVDFFGHYAPDSRRYQPAFTRTLTGFGTMLSIGFIAILDYCSGLGNKKSWLGDSVNESRLDLIYRAYVVVALFNCFLYAYVSSSYSYDNIIGIPEEEEDIPFFEPKQETEAGDQQQVTYQLQKVTVR